MNRVIHAPGCTCEACWQRREEQSRQYEGQPSRSLAGKAQAAGNGVAYLVFGIIGLVVALFIIKWAITEYWITTHCTEVLGTRVCK